MVLVYPVNVVADIRQFCQSQVHSELQYCTQHVMTSDNLGVQHYYGSTECFLQQQLWLRPLSSNVAHHTVAMTLDNLGVLLWKDGIFFSITAVAPPTA